jgi:phosphatidylinositol alpha-1,6-mannosyltransferase
MMWEICKGLGPDRVSCLTGINGADAPEPSDVHVYRAPRAFSGNRIVRSASLGAALSGVLLSRRPAVLQLATCYEGWLGLLMKRLFSIPFVVYAHGNEVIEAARDPWDKPRTALREAARVLACSGFTARLVEDMGVSGSRIVRINPGCDTHRFRPGLLPERRPEMMQSGPIILTVGNLVERKGHDMVIRALSRIRTQFPRLQYVIVGDGPNRSTLQDLVSSLGLRDAVLFTGRVSDSELPEYYAVSDVVIMASRERMDASDVEGFGITFLEAAACGKPAIAGRSGGTSDAVVNGVTGMLIDPEDPADIAGALTCLLSNGEMRRKMGDHARARVLAEFTWRHVGERVGQALQEAVASR